MARPRWSSVRFRLTALNMVVLALVLGSFGAILAYGVDLQLSRGVDRELSDRARSITEPFLRMGMLPPPWGPAPGMQPGPAGRFAGPERPGQPGPGAFIGVRGAHPGQAESQARPEPHDGMFQQPNPDLPPSDFQPGMIPKRTPLTSPKPEGAQPEGQNLFAPRPHPGSPQPIGPGFGGGMGGPGYPGSGGFQGPKGPPFGPRPGGPWRPGVPPGTFGPKRKPPFDGVGPGGGFPGRTYSPPGGAESSSTGRRVLMAQVIGLSPAAKASSRQGQQPGQRSEDFFRRPRVLHPEGHGFGATRPDRPWDEATFQQSLRGRREFSTITYGNEPVRVLSLPLQGVDRIAGVVQVAHPIAEQQRFQQGLVTALFMLVPLAALAAGAAGAFLTGRALLPVRHVTYAAAQIGADDLSRRLRVEGDDEFSDLARTFNGMIGRLDSAFQDLEKAYEQQRRFTGDASHELRTPLTTIKANTSLALQGERSPAEYQEALRAADRAADTMNRIVQDLLLLTRSDAGTLSLEKQVIPIEAPISNALELVRHVPGAQISLDLAPEPLTILGDVHHLTRLVTNLLENALRHTPPTGRIEIAARLVDGRVVVRVLDSGEGIPSEHLPRVFDRFYRVDVARARNGHAQGLGGTGLGLAICRSIVQAHGGEITLQSQPGRGTAVLVTLPLHREEQAPLPPPPLERTLAAV